MATTVLDHRFGSDSLRDRCAYALCELGADGVLGRSPNELGLPKAGVAGRRLTTEALLGGPVEHRLVVAPGSVRLAYGRARGFERHRLSDDELTAKADELRQLYNRLAAVELLDPWYDSYEVQDRLLGHISRVRLELGFGAHVKGRSRCGEWSRKSRARMVRRISTLDPRPFQPTDELVPAMMTLTYPGDYLAVCPTGESSKRQLRAFRSAFERKYGPQSAIWKLERQRRGAPHYHLLVMVPNPYGPDGFEQYTVYRNWCRETWARVVGATGSDRMKHERAGVSIDLSEGARYCDPQRIAVYFGKHGAPGVESSKAFQNEAPDGWLDPDDGGGVGRWWGYWRVKPIELEAIVDDDAAVELVRLLRGWVKSQGRTRRVVRKRVDRQTGLVRLRKQTERFTVRALAHCRPAGFVLANDGPNLAAQLGRAIADREDWPPGQPRPLP